MWPRSSLPVPSSTFRWDRGDQYEFSPAMPPNWRIGSFVPWAGWARGSPSAVGDPAAASICRLHCRTWPMTHWWLDFSIGWWRGVNWWQTLAATVALPGHEPKLSQGERKLKNELAEAIRAGGMSPPDLTDLTGSAGARSSAVPDLLALLRDEHRIVEIHSSLFLDVDTESELRRRVMARLADGSAIAMSELRDLLGTTRRYAVPLGEYLDRIGLTKREGDTRRLGLAAVPPASSVTLRRLQLSRLD